MEAAKILIVDDEKFVRRTISRVLSSEGFATFEASNGPDALRMAQEQPFDLMILDIVMDGMDGFQVIRTLRDQGILLPVFVLSGRQADNDKILALGIGADDYITKPFSVKLVLMRVEAVLRRVEEHKTQVSENILTYENVRLDQAAHLVSVDGNSVALTNTEYELLELFLLHPGRVFSRDHLLNQVWGYDIACEEKTVNIHIMNLRRKLGTNIIETIRGVGYRLGKED